MASGHFEAESSPVLSEGKAVYILGPIHLQNSLMASFLEGSTGARCLAIESLSGIVRRDDDTLSLKKLVLWDRFGKNVQECLLEYETNARQMSSADLVALFNLSYGLGIEERIIPRGVQGFFYRQDPLEQIAKGIKAMFEGELWVSRKILSRCLRRESEQKSRLEKDASMLTPREVEILGMVAVVATNVQIADRLFVSRHTVKTHLYNIFKKINVPNRLQATLWAAKHL